MFGFNPIPISTVDINGIYIKESSENFFEYLKSFGVEDDIALRVLNSKHPLVVSNADDIKVTILVKDNPRTFIFGEELPYTLSTGQDVVTVASRDCGTLTFNTYLAENPETTEVRVLEFIDDELVSTSTNHLGVKAVNRYKKVS